MKRIRKLADLSLGVTYDVARRNGPPFRGRFLRQGEKPEGNAGPSLEFAVFVVSGEHRTVWDAEFVSAKPVTGGLFRRH